MARRISIWALLAALVAVFIISQPVFAQFRMIDLGTLGGNAAAAKINNHGQVIGGSVTASGEWHGFLWTAEGGMIDLGTLGGSESNALGINDQGQVVGYSKTASGDYHAFLRTTEGEMVDLGTLSNGTYSEADAINNLGQVVGERTTLPGDPNEDPTLWDTGHAFLWTTEGGMIDLGTLGGSGSGAIDINDLGQVVGASKTASDDYHAFLRTTEGEMVDLGTLGGSFSYAGAINNKGQVAGDAETASGEDHAFLWTAAGGMVDLGTLGGLWIVPNGINNAGQVVGYGQTASGEDHAFLWTAAGGMIDLGTLGGAYSFGYAINNQGQIVGNAETASGEDHAFLWTAAGGMVDLGTLGGNWSFAYSINNLGQVVGASVTASGEEHAVLWELASPALASFSIFAMNSVWLFHGAQVNSGNIGVQDKSSGPWCAAKTEVMIGNRAYLKDKVAIYGDSVMIFPGASVYDVYYNELQNMGKIRGDKYTPLELPLDVVLPAFPTPHPGTKDYVVPTGRVLILEPGSYGKIKVELKATLILTGGSYHVEDLIV